MSNQENNFKPKDRLICLKELKYILGYGPTTNVSVFADKLIADGLPLMRNGKRGKFKVRESDVTKYLDKLVKDAM